MKTKHLLTIILSAFLLPSCIGNNIWNTIKPTYNPSNVDDGSDKKEDGEDETKLANAKQKAIDDLSTYVDKTLYRDAEKTEIDNIINDGIRVIASAKSTSQVKTILELYKGYLLEVKTDAEYKKEAFAKCISTDQIRKFKKGGYTNLYNDPNYKDGYIVSKCSYGAGENPLHEEYLKTYDNNNVPTWSIAQWTSRYDLMGTGENDGYTLTQDQDAVINTYTSKGKNGIPAKVIRANSMTGELYLEENTSVEYEHARKSDEGWVHLLYGQDFENNLINVKECASIVMDAEFTVNYCENLMSANDYNTNMHTAQLVWYITLQNRTGGYSNPDFGKYIWFGIGLWDYRSSGKECDMYRAHDAGTDTLIYNPGSADYYKDTNGLSPKIGEKGHANIDIRPFAEQAYQYAKDNGYLGNTQFEDLYIGGTNFGYEIPGTFDIGSTIHSINVFYKKDSSNVDPEVLAAQNTAKTELANYLDLSKYRDAQKEEIQAILNEANQMISNSLSTTEVAEKLAEYKALLNAVKTDAQLKQEAYDACKSTAQIETYKKQGYTNIYKDSNFKNGYHVSKVDQVPGQDFYHSDPLNPFGKKTTPIWDLCQWNSKYDIMGSGTTGGYTLTSDENNVINTYTSKGKTIGGIEVPAKKFTANSQTGELYIEENGRAEYEHARTSSEGWPCILFQQDFSNDLTKVDACDSLIFECDYQVHSCINYTGTGYSSNTHAAQLLVYVTVQNRNTSHPDFGKYIWFGFMLYDDRYDNKTSTIYRGHDAGTDTLIYNLPSSEYLKTNNNKIPTVGQRVKAQIDIIPYIKEAMTYSKNNGYLGNTSYEDLYISGTNFGYEIPGTFDISSTIYSINFFRKYK